MLRSMSLPELTKIEFVPPVVAMLIPRPVIALILMSFVMLAEKLPEIMM
jgi:hypothetical protein